MTHKHQEDDRVVLMEDHGDYLPAGSAGTIFCLYTTMPPAYEVIFECVDGKSFGGIFHEDEIEAVQQVQPLVGRETAAVN